MSLHPAPASHDTPTDQWDADARFFRDTLHDLIGMGTSLARAIHARALRDAEAEAPMPDPTPAFDRVARAVRRTILLARHIAEARPVPATRIAARKRIIREVEDTIGRSAKSQDAETLRAELLDRLDAPDLEDDIALRPVADIVADIVRDLGLAAAPGTRPWKRRTPQDLATLAARAAAPRPHPGRAAVPIPARGGGGTPPRALTG